MNFPILRLMKADFIDYYKEKDADDENNQFRKLSFIFNIDTTATLLWYALKYRRIIMNPNDKGIPLTDAGDGPMPISNPFKIGTFEITYRELRHVIGPHYGVLGNFHYLRFEAREEDGFIVYDVYFNNSTQAILATKIIGKKPSPPYNQD